MRMKELCFVFFVLASTYAQADWEKIDAAASDQIETFIDAKRIRQSGPMNTMRRVWEVSNLPQRLSNNALSIKTQLEYDCKDRRVRTLEEALFPEHFARGTPIAAKQEMVKTGDWLVINKASVTEVIFNRVCPSG
jgi:hypothetical protein